MRYAKLISTGQIMMSGNESESAVLNNMLSSGYELNDIQIVETDSATLAGLLKIQDTPTASEQWELDMANFKLSRETEDLITAGSLTMNEYQKTIYDAKVKRRLEKP